MNIYRCISVNSNHKKIIISVIQPKETRLSSSRCPPLIKVSSRRSSLNRLEVLRVLYSRKIKGKLRERKTCGMKRQ